MTRSIVACSVGAVVMLCRIARAEPDSDLQALLQDPVVSTPSMGSSSASVAPATSTSISAEQLRAQGIRSLDEAINYASLGMVTAYNMHAVEIGARGVLLNGDYGNHVLLLVNGLTLNEPWNDTAYLDRGAGIPFELVDRIEVMLGPGSVVYGSQAMLGVINIVTKSASAYPGGHAVVEGELASPLGARYALRDPRSRGYLSDLGRGYRVGVGLGKEFELFELPSEVTLELEQYAFRGAAIEFAPQDYGDDAVTGEPKRFGPGTGTGVWGGTAQRSWFADVPTSYARLAVGDFTLSTRVGSYQRAAPYGDVLVRYLGDFDPRNDYERDRYLDFELRHEKRVASAVKLFSRVYGKRQDYQWWLTSSAPEDCEEGQATGCRYDLYTRARRLGAEVRASFDWQDGWFMTTQLGLTGQVRWVDSRSITRSALGDGDPTGVIDATESQGAVYLEHTLRPSSSLDLNAGLRHDADERFGSKLSPRAAIAWSSWRDATWKVIYAEAFRAPSAYELHYEDPLSEVPAADLGPETTRTVEGSFEQRFGPHRLLWGMFRSWWTDMVALRPIGEEEQQRYIDSGQLAPGASDVTQYQNLSRIDNCGFNASYAVSLLQGRLKLDANLTGAKTRVHMLQGVTGPLTVTPQYFGNARATYDLSDGLPTLGLAMTFRGRQLGDLYYDGGFRTPPTAPGSWELRTTVSGPTGLTPGLDYRVSVTYNHARVAPYNIGAVQYAYDASTRADLQPVNRLYGFAGLQYDFPL
jgi:outer membrane receptor for ferrienterochelin and colicins